jgi:hypothetical protein
MGILSVITGKPGASGFGSASTAEKVTAGVDASALTIVVTGNRRSNQHTLFEHMDVVFSLVAIAHLQP